MTTIAVNVYWWNIPKRCLMCVTTKRSPRVAVSQLIFSIIFSNLSGQRYKLHLVMLFPLASNTDAFYNQTLELMLTATEEIQ